MRQTIKLLAGLGLAIAAPQVSFAQYSIFTGNLGGFVSNSATAGFTAAIGGSADEHRDFDTNKFGTPSGATIGAAGNSFSNGFIFRTVASANGGIGGALVNWGGAAGESEVGPYNVWDGLFVIDFLGAGTLANAVGLGNVEFTTAAENLRIYDQNGVLSYSTTGSAIGTQFSFFGAVSTGATKIGRIEMDGSFFAIQDISVDYAGVTVVTPEPSTVVLTGVGLLAAFGAARRRRKA